MRTLSASFRLLLLAAFTVTFSVALASPGDLYDADFTSGNIYRFTPNGGRSVFASGLNGPEGLAFDAQRNLYVSETGTGIIYRYAPDGTRTIFATGLNGPASLVFGNSGDLYDAEFFGGQIYIFTPAAARTTLAQGLNGPANLLFDRVGNLFQTDFRSGTVFKYTPGGARSTFASGLGSPHALAFDVAGNLFVGDFASGTIFRVTPEGARSTFATGLSGPHGLAFDGNGNLFEGDYNTGAIFVFTPAGVRTPFASGLSNPANLIFEPGAPATTRNKLLNLSTRGFVGADSSVLIGGIIVEGTTPSTVVLRAIGPSLTAFNVPGALEDPTVDLYDGAGTKLQTNDNWQAGPDAGAIATAALAPNDPREAALLATLPAGQYTAIVRGAGATTGIGLVELYDVGNASGQRASNISTRGLVLPGDGVLIAGCIVGGNERKNLVLRALGPSLRRFQVNDALDDPKLDLFDGNGAKIATNESWQNGPDAAAIQALGRAPDSAAEAAILVSLLPGSYTAVESPASGTSGVGLIEIYDVSRSE